MKCEQCLQPATVHLTNIERGTATARHLCAEHARRYAQAEGAPSRRGEVGDKHPGPAAGRSRARNRRSHTGPGRQRGVRRRRAARWRPETFSTEQRTCLRMSRSAIDPLEGPTVVVGRKLSGRPWLNGIPFNQLLSLGYWAFSHHEDSGKAQGSDGISGLRREHRRAKGNDLQPDGGRRPTIRGEAMGVR